MVQANRVVPVKRMPGYRTLKEMERETRQNKKREHYRANARIARAQKARLTPKQAKEMLKEAIGADFLPRTEHATEVTKWARRVHLLENAKKGQKGNLLKEAEFVAAALEKAGLRKGKLSASKKG